MCICAFQAPLKRETTAARGTVGGTYIPPPTTRFESWIRSLQDARQRGHKNLDRLDNGVHMLNIEIQGSEGGNISSVYRRAVVVCTCFCKRNVRCDGCMCLCACCVSVFLSVSLCVPM